MTVRRGGDMGVGVVGTRGPGGEPGARFFGTIDRLRLFLEGAGTCAAAVVVGDAAAVDVVVGGGGGTSATVGRGDDTA